MTIAKAKTYYRARLKRLRAEMKIQGIDAVVLVNDVDIFYVTGFGGEDSSLVITPKRTVVVTDSRFVTQIKEECPGLSLLCRKDRMGVAIRQVLSKGLTSKQYDKLHITTAMGHVSLLTFKQLKKDIGKGLKAGKDLLMPLRVLKDAYEVSRIKVAAKVAQDALSETLDFIKVGMSEIEIASKLEYEMAKRGGGPPAFGSIVAFGGHAAHPHAIPGKRKLKKNDTILIDWGATVGGYRSDLTRCFITGKMNREYREAYETCLKAQLNSIAAIAPGVAMCEVDEAARSVIRKSKFPMYGHGTGHAIGLDVHETPSFSRKDKATLVPGMVLTVEPGIYLDGKYGIRIEDDVLITENGYKLLTSMPKSVSTLTQL